MTTRVHIVNIGPSVVTVQKVNPQSTAPAVTDKLRLYTGDSVNEYVYDNQAIEIVEVPKERK